MIVVKVDNLSVTNSKLLKTAKFTSDYSQLQAVRDFVNRLCIQAPGDTGTLSAQMQLAINEAFCNIVRHGYKGESGHEVVIRGHLEENRIVFELSDQGISLDPHSVPEPSLSGDRSSGFGIYMIQELSNRVSYMMKKRDDGWNHMRIFKNYIKEKTSMNLTHQEQDGVLVVTLEGQNLDAQGVSLFKADMMNLIEATTSKHVVLNLKHLEFIDSSGLGSLLSVLRQLNATGGDLRLTEMGDPVRAMFELVRMHKLFEIFNSLEEAVHSFN